MADNNERPPIGNDNDKDKTLQILKRADDRIKAIITSTDLANKSMGRFTASFKNASEQAKILTEQLKELRNITGSINFPKINISSSSSSSIVNRPSSYTPSGNKGAYQMGGTQYGFTEDELKKQRQQMYEHLFKQLDDAAKEVEESEKKAAKEEEERHAAAVKRAQELRKIEQEEAKLKEQAQKEAARAAKEAQKEEENLAKARQQVAENAKKLREEEERLRQEEERRTENLKNQQSQSKASALRSEEEQQRKDDESLRAAKETSRRNAKILKEEEDKIAAEEASYQNREWTREEKQDIYEQLFEQADKRDGIAAGATREDIVDLLEENITNKLFGGTLAGRVLGNKVVKEKGVNGIIEAITDEKGSIMGGIKEILVNHPYLTILTGIGVSLKLIKAGLEKVQQLQKEANKHMAKEYNTARFLGRPVSGTTQEVYEQAKKRTEIMLQQAQEDQLEGEIMQDLNGWFTNFTQGIEGAILDLEGMQPSELSDTIQEFLVSMMTDAIKQGTSRDAAGFLAGDIYTLAKKYAGNFLTYDNDLEAVRTILPSEMAYKMQAAVGGDESALDEFGLFINDQILEGFMALHHNIDMVNVEYSESWKQLQRQALLEYELNILRDKGAKSLQNFVASMQRTGETMEHFKDQLFSFDEVITLNAYNPEHYGELTEEDAYPYGKGDDSGGTDGGSGSDKDKDPFDNHYNFFGETGPGSNPAGLYNPYEQIFDKTGTYAAISNPVNLVRTMMQSGAIDTSGQTYEIPDEFKSYVYQQLTQWYKENPTGEHHIAGTLYRGTDYATLAEALAAVGLSSYAGPITQQATDSYSLGNMLTYGDDLKTKTGIRTPLGVSMYGDLAPHGQMYGNSQLFKDRQSPFDRLASQSYNTGYTYENTADLARQRLQGTSVLSGYGADWTSDGRPLDTGVSYDPTKMANGGIGTRELHNVTLFEGDKKEAVIPLETPEGISYLSSALQEAGMASGGAGGDSITINLTLTGLNISNNQSDWQWVAQKIAEEIDVQRQRRGELNYGASY